LGSRAKKSLVCQSGSARGVHLLSAESGAVAVARKREWRRRKTGGVVVPPQSGGAQQPSVVSHAAAPAYIIGPDRIMAIMNFGSRKIELKGR
jgi:hypothetical protein